MLHRKTISGKGLQQVSWVLGEGWFRYESNVNRDLVVGFSGDLLGFFFYLRHLNFS